ncbi:cation:proton antiporter [Microbacterium sp. LBN7]|uniref:cation:proton antiporter domain-containing protein n=1 Tax=Microbacterium sp. LBN7 TaxID=3129773 RepID=UPI003253E822
MLMVIVASLVAILIWAVLAARLERWHVSGPVAMACAGIVTGLLVGPDIGTDLNTDIAEKTAELILAVLLFVDATEVRGGFLAGERGLVGRLLGIALPLTIVVAFGLGVLLLDGSSWAVPLAIACVVMPIDFAPAAHLLRDGRWPRRVRHTVAVESGYNDGIFSPVFAFALLYLSQSHTEDLGTAVGAALEAAGIALLVGVVIGAASGALVWVSVRRGWTRTSGVRIVMVLVPLIVYAIATPLGGNGFVAAFLAGIAYKLCRNARADGQTDIPAAELSAVEDLATTTSLIMWFVFGAVGVLVLEIGFQWTWILFALLALTVVRLLPVLISLLGSRLPWRERMGLGLLGPRGTSSIVFGLLAYNAMNDDDADIAVYVMVVVVLGSLILHGLAMAVRSRHAHESGSEPHAEVAH